MHCTVALNNFFYAHTCLLPFLSGVKITTERKYRLFNVNPLPIF